MTPSKPQTEKDGIALLHSLRVDGPGVLSEISCRTGFTSKHAATLLRGLRKRGLVSYSSFGYWAPR